MFTFQPGILNASRSSLQSKHQWVIITRREDQRELFAIIYKAIKLPVLNGHLPAPVT